MTLLAAEHIKVERGGRAILKAIQKLDYDVWTRRPEVSKRDKVMLLIGAIATRWTG